MLDVLGALGRIKHGARAWAVDSATKLPSGDRATAHCVLMLNAGVGVVAFSEGAVLVHKYQVEKDSNDGSKALPRSGASGVDRRRERQVGGLISRAWTNTERL